MCRTRRRKSYLMNYQRFAIATRFGAKFTITCTVKKILAGILMHHYPQTYFLQLHQFTFEHPHYWRLMEIVIHHQLPG